MAENLAHSQDAVPLLRKHMECSISIGTIRCVARLAAVAQTPPLRAIWRSEQGTAGLTPIAPTPQ